MTIASGTLLLVGALAAAAAGDKSSAIPPPPTRRIPPPPLYSPLPLATSQPAESAQDDEPAPRHRRDTEARTSRHSNEGCDEACERRRISRVYLIVGHKACQDKEPDRCAHAASQALELDPENTAAKQLLTVATLQGGKAHQSARSFPGFQTGLHRLGVEASLFPVRESELMHLTGPRYNRQVLGWPLLLRFGAASSFGRLLRHRGGPEHFAFTAEATLSLGREWPIRRYGAFGILGEIIGGGLLVADSPLTYIIRPKIALEVSYGRLSAFFGVGFMHYGLNRKSADKQDGRAPQEPGENADGSVESITIAPSVSFGISIGFGT